MIVKIDVRKHGFRPAPKPDGRKDDWRTITCLVDLLRAEAENEPTPSGWHRVCPRRIAWTMQEWDGER